MGLKLPTPRSKVTCSTYWASQAPPLDILDNVLLQLLVPLPQSLVILICLFIFICFLNYQWGLFIPPFPGSIKPWCRSSGVAISLGGKWFWKTLPWLSFPDHNQLLNSTNWWQIALLLLRILWGHKLLYDQIQSNSDSFEEVFPWVSSWDFSQH